VLAVAACIGSTKYEHPFPFVGLFDPEDEDFSIRRNVDTA
jgi:hypothetical protein